MRSESEPEPLGLSVVGKGERLFLVKRSMVVGKQVEYCLPLSRELVDVLSWTPFQKRILHRPPALATLLFHLGNTTKAERL